MVTCLRPFSEAFFTTWNYIVKLDNLPPKRKMQIFTGVCTVLMLILAASTYFVFYLSDINDIAYLERQGYTVKPKMRRVLDLQLMGIDLGRDFATSYELNTFPMVDYDESNLHEMREAAALLAKPVTVVLRAVPALKKLEGFEDLSNLKVLHVVGGEGVTDLTNLRKSDSLQGISVNRVHSLQKLGSLVESPKLRYLWLEQAESFIDFESFSRLRELDVLAVIGNDHLTDLSVLANVEKLRYLNLSYCPNLTNFKALRKLKSLKKLVVEDCGILPEEQKQIRRALPGVTIRFEEEVEE